MKKKIIFSIIIYLALLIIIVFSAYLIRINEAKKTENCPDRWVIDYSCNTADISCEKEEYFIKDGKRRGLEDYDINWIKTVCHLIPLSSPDNIISSYGENPKEDLKKSINIYFWLVNIIALLPVFIGLIMTKNKLYKDTPIKQRKGKILFTIGLIFLAISTLFYIFLRILLGLY